MEEIVKTLPQHSSSWLKGTSTFYKYQGFWHAKVLIEGVIRAQRSFKAQPNEVLLCSYPKTGATWLKALAFAIVTRKRFDESTSPLLTTVPHECIPFLENEFEGIDSVVKNPDFPLIATHIPYTSLPESVIASNCKIVYIYRDAKDVLVSYYEFARKALNIPVEDAPFEEAFDEFCRGLSWYGPYWDHILGYWKASLERPGRILFLKYEDVKNGSSSNVKRLAEFIGFPISIEEEQAGVVENIIKLCSFEHLSGLEVNQTTKLRAKNAAGAENQLFFRKAKVGDWENYLTEEMKDKIDKLMDQKLGGTGLVL